MAPQQFTKQTKEIVWCFFDDGPSYETDGPVNGKCFLWVFYNQINGGIFMPSLLLL